MQRINKYYIAKKIYEEGKLKINYEALEKVGTVNTKFIAKIN